MYEESILIEREILHIGMKHQSSPPIICTNGSEWRKSKKLMKERLVKKVYNETEKQHTC